MRDTEETKHYFKKLQARDESELDKVILTSQELFGFLDRSSLDLAYANLNTQP
jgi:hypothetical protein